LFPWLCSGPPPIVLSLPHFSKLPLSGMALKNGGSLLPSCFVPPLPLLIVCPQGRGPSWSIKYHTGKRQFFGEVFRTRNMFRKRRRD
jgi:hypothetical protein